MDKNEILLTKPATSQLDKTLVASEFPYGPKDPMYLNTGSCGRKPASVIAALEDGWSKLNQNPTLTTFFETELREDARSLAAEMFGVERDLLMLTESTTEGLQLMMHAYLLKEGDELVITDHEHGCLNTIARYLEETRGIVVRKHKVQPELGSHHHCQGVATLVSAKTKLVAVSEIDCFTGWRPNLDALIAEMHLAGLPLLVDGAHSPGQGPVDVSRFDTWVSSAHKWLGSPNGIGFAYFNRKVLERLSPVWVGHKYFETRAASPSAVYAFECRGTEDMVKFLGLTAALKLQKQLGERQIAERQLELMLFARKRLAETVRPNFLLPEPKDMPAEELTALLAFDFEPSRLLVDDLVQALWERDKIWIQPDYLLPTPGHGVRISCHYSLSEDDIERFVQALSKLIKK
ncbi:MAG: hypothetical protein C0469_03610 [Cyanobacteria bacterium DS2.3.42]|nr:hypothetical protein [Cyanobacteria bacterium DS2.3.42]